LQGPTADGLRIVTDDPLQDAPPTLPHVQTEQPRVSSSAANAKCFETYPVGGQGTSPGCAMHRFV
jgi:hypothetical protein